jgi:DNA-binding XRE family transcriptional regulator
MKKSAAKAVRERWRRAAGSVIARSRGDAHLSQTALAAAIGWSRDTLAKVEAGKRKVEFGDVMLVADAVKKTPEALIRRILVWHE